MRAEWQPTDACMEDKVPVFHAWALANKAIQAVRSACRGDFFQVKVQREVGVPPPRERGGPEGL